MAAEKKNRQLRVPQPVAAPEPEDALGEEFVQEAPSAEAEPEEPKVRTRKQAEAEAETEAAGGSKKGKKPASSAIKPTDDLVRNKNGEVRKDEDGDEMRYAPGFHSGAGYVNENGVRFPPGYKAHGAFVGTFGNVIMNRCPQCGHQQSIDESRTGICGNQKCRYDAVAKFEEYELD